MLAVFSFGSELDCFAYRIPATRIDKSGHALFGSLKVFRRCD